jgi:ATP-dependent exoDNAse (exonuclease V) beta subunit
MPAEGATSGGMRLVQGVLDCCFLSDSSTPEERAWVLLDYKTDADPDISALRERYAPQIALYARALTDITKWPVATATLYLVKKEAFCVYGADALTGNQHPRGELI